ncbi:MAG: LysR family transcriptional regulator [Rhodospirillales bacterium]|nr:LysR family transcriptional regulator [Rhodospirillales bacterium]
MDTELARTFLAVVAAGSFVSAAERLHVTQSTVSARIHSLEEMLGARLFVRNKAGTFLTPSGRRFEAHALVLVRTVERLRQDVGIAEGFEYTLTVGARFGLWDRFLIYMLPILRDRLPNIAVHAEMGFEPDLMQSLIDGRMDIGLMFTPQNRPGLRVEHLFDESLVLVTSDPNEQRFLDKGYIYVDWGPEFYAKHRASFPEFSGPAMTVGIGWLGIAQIMNHGGSGYFPVRLVRPHLDAKKLFVVEGAEEFSLPAYMVYNNAIEERALDVATQIIRELALNQQETPAY